MKQKNPLWIAGTLGTLLSSLEIVEGRDVPHEQMPHLGEKMVQYVQTRKGLGEGKIPEKSPEYAFILNLADAFRAILESTKTDKEKAIGLREIIQGKKTEYEVMIQGSRLGFQDKNDFHASAQGLVEVAGGAAATLEKTVIQTPKVVQITAQKITDATTPASGFGSGPEGVTLGELEGLMKDWEKEKNTQTAGKILTKINTLMEFLTTKKKDTGENKQKEIAEGIETLRVLKNTIDTALSELSKKGLDEVNLLLGTWKKSPTQEKMEELLQKTAALDTLPEQKNLSTRLETNKNAYGLYTKTAGRLREYLTDLRKHDFLGIGKRDIDQAEAVVSNFELAEKNMIDIGITLDKNNNVVVGEILSLLTRAADAQASWRNTIQDVASSLSDSSAEFDRATGEFLTHPNPQIDILIGRHFPRRAEFMEKVAEFYNTVNSGAIDEAGVGEITNHIDELKIQNSTSPELSPIFDGLKRMVELAPKPEKSDSTVAIAGFLVFLAGLSVFLLSRKKNSKGAGNTLNQLDWNSVPDIHKHMTQEELFTLNDRVDEYSIADLHGNDREKTARDVVTYLMALAKSTDSYIIDGGFQDIAFSLLNNTDGVSKKGFTVLENRYGTKGANERIYFFKECIQSFLQKENIFNGSSPTRQLMPVIHVG